MAKSRRTVQVTSHQFIRSAGKAIGHPNYDRLLQAQHIGQLWELRHRFHNGKLRRTRITEHVCHALVKQQLDESLTTCHFLNSHFRLPRLFLYLDACQPYSPASLCIRAGSSPNFFAASNISDHVVESTGIPFAMRLARDSRSGSPATRTPS